MEFRQIRADVFSFIICLLLRSVGLCCVGRSVVVVLKGNGIKSDGTTIGSTFGLSSTEVLVFASDDVLCVKERTEYSFDMLVIVGASRMEHNIITAMECYMVVFIGFRHYNCWPKTMIGRVDSFLYQI